MSSGMHPTEPIFRRNIHQCRAYALRRMSLAVDRVIRVQSVSDKARAVQWVGVWKIAINGGVRMSLYQRDDSPFWWVLFSSIRGELKPLQKSTETKIKRQAQQYHDKLQGERWEQDKLGVKPKHT